MRFLDSCLPVLHRGTVILGFEQANKYTVLDQDGNVVALLAEDMGGLGKEVGRQFLRTRRSFTATILSPEGPGCSYVCSDRISLQWIEHLAAQLCHQLIEWSHAKP